MAIEAINLNLAGSAMLELGKIRLTDSRISRNDTSKVTGTRSRRLQRGK